MSGPAGSTGSTGPEGPLPFVLASGSPRRLELLGRVGLSPRVEPAEVDESVLPGEEPVAYVGRLAALKAQVVARRCPGTIVLGADTAVVLDGAALGKPADRGEALTMLTRLSGRTHDVLTAVAVVGADQQVHAAVASTQVTMAVLGRIELEWYVGTGEPFDKAGGYGLQGAGGALVESVTGDPTTVIGLPLRTALALLVRAGLAWPSSARV